MSSDVRQTVEQFFEQYPLRQFKKRDMIIFAGEPPAGIFHVLKGHVRQYDVGTNGDEIVVNVFKPPAFFPMAYAINQTANEYFFDAVTSVTARMAPAADTLEFVRSNPDVTFDLLSRILRGAEGLLRRQAHLMGGTAANRLMYELIMSCQRFGVSQSDGAYFVAIKETELAARAGLTRETVNRQIHQLKKRKLVRLNSSGITVSNLSALQALLGESL